MNELLSSQSNEGFTLWSFQMMTFMNEAVDTLMQKVGGISKTGEIVDFHR